MIYNPVTVTVYDTLLYDTIPPRDLYSAISAFKSSTYVCIYNV